MIFNSHNWSLEYEQWTTIEITKIYQNCHFRRKLFDEAPEDSNYTPLPEDRPGGFNWGEERAQNEAADNDE